MSDPEVLIIGAGPGGYVAAIRLGQLVKKVLVIDKDKIGGVCLNYGCIPTKTLLHFTKIISEATKGGKFGIKYNKPEIDFPNFNQQIQNIPARLRKGIEYLFRNYNIQFVQAEAKFFNNSTVSFMTADGKIQKCTPEFIIIAAGSRNAILSDITPDQKTIITSDEALIINAVPASIAIIGAGPIGLEFATIYSRLGSKVKVIEIMPQILPGTDVEIVKTLTPILKKQGIDIFINVKITKVSKSESIQIDMLINGKEDTINVDKILVAVGRKPNTDNLGLENTNLKLTEKKFIDVNENYVTSQKQIYAIGDIIGQPLLAHKAMAQGVFVAEKITGHQNLVRPSYIPNCTYTDPEVATIGLTENEAKSQNYDILIGKVPLSAIGRAHAMNQIEGIVKVIIDKKTDHILGAQILAPDASNIISEITLAMRAGITAKDIVDTVHPHPTISEAISEAFASAYKKAIHIINH